MSAVLDQRWPAASNVSGAVVAARPLIPGLTSSTCGRRAPFHLDTSRPDSWASLWRELSCDRQFSQSISAQMGLCARKRKELLVTERDAKVPPVCVGIFFFFPFFSALRSCPLLPGSFMCERCHVQHCKWVMGTHRYTVHICFICSLLA